MRRLRVTATMVAMLGVGCGGSRTPDGMGGVDAGAQDAPSAVMDAEPDASVDLDGGADAFVASECPAPEVLGYDDVPPGYLPPVEVRYLRTVDGDTAHFSFPTSADQTVRFLFVNTEESHGDETTAFGELTGTVVRDWLRAAREIVIAVREDSRNPGQPNLDPYDRWLSLIFLDGELLQTRIVREGYSAYYTQFGCAPDPVHTALVRAEAEANANARGIWRLGHPKNYEPILEMWIPRNRCRPNPFDGPYCAP